MKRLQALLNKQGNDLKIDGTIGPKTIEALEGLIKLRLIEFPKIPFLCGIRTDSKLTNTFDDYLYIRTNVVKRVVPCSTTPGKYWIKHPMNAKGTAILKPGLYKNSHKFITNPNWNFLWLKAPYFQQVQPVTVYRDANGNELIDRYSAEIGLFGINIHRGGLGSFIDRWSAGCIVVPDNDWYKLVYSFNNGDIISLGLVEI